MLPLPLSWEPIEKYINEQYEKFLKEEVNIARKKRIPDTRVHCCLYFISPTGHSYVPDPLLLLAWVQGVSFVPKDWRIHTWTKLGRARWLEGHGPVTLGFPRLSIRKRVKVSITAPLFPILVTGIPAQPSFTNRENLSRGQELGRYLRWPRLGAREGQER